MPQSSTVIDNIRAEMARSRVTQAQLGKGLELSQQAISARMAGRTPFTVPELLRAAQLLGVAPESLMAGVAA